MKKIILFLFVALFLGQPLFSDTSGAYLFAKLDKHKITIGDKVKLTLILEYDKGIKLDTFNPDENLKSFEIKDYKVSKERKKYFLWGRIIRKHEYVLSTFTTGIYEIKPFTINFVNKTGQSAQSQTNTLKVEVTSLLDKESAADIRDIKPPVSLKTNPLVYIITFGILVLFIIGGLVYRYYSVKKSPARLIGEIVDPYKYAIDELSKLESMDLVKKGLVKQFFIELTQILRLYLSKIFFINILDMTTSESLRAVREKGADRGFLVKLRNLFEFSDLVKFAKYIPEEKEIAVVFESAKNIVEMARPDPPKIPQEERGESMEPQRDGNQSAGS
ncbi:MAG: hypothetical protein JW983_08920 [Elusimicrobia bacterium]|nr:hypothetical protein [Elusimicrobiota bacterium]